MRFHYGSTTFDCPTPLRPAPRAARRLPRTAPTPHAAGFPGKEKGPAEQPEALNNNNNNNDGVLVQSRVEFAPIQLPVSPGVPPSGGQVHCHPTGTAAFLPWRVRPCAPRGALSVVVRVGPRFGNPLDVFDQVSHVGATDPLCPPGSEAVC
jgi:hypothetical protein